MRLYAKEFDWLLGMKPNSDWCIFLRSRIGLGSLPGLIDGWKSKKKQKKKKQVMKLNDIKRNRINRFGHKMKYNNLKFNRYTGNINTHFKTPFSKVLLIIVD